MSVLAPFSPRPQLIQSNKAEYGEVYDSLRFPSEPEAAAALEKRAQLLEALRPIAQTGCGGTKLDCASLSPGCAVCARGKWSCLFISGKCNCRCFYCPAKQDEGDLPTTNSLAFPRVEDYIDYLTRFEFTGASISGGEPLLTLDTTLGFVSAIKRALGNHIHLWLYTNGTLATREILGRLADAGLDEIRFDIGATGFRLDHARLAVGLIPTVTVEIPAVPEELDLLKRRIEEMKSAGVAHLNLHQLRLTPHNAPHLAKRSYTFLHGEKVTVLESELTALELIRHSIENGIGLPVNYCSFVYKNRYQRAAARGRSAALVKKSFEETTPNGYIRRLSALGEPQAVGALATRLREAGIDDVLWATAGKDRLHFHPDLWPRVDFANLRLAIAYFEPRILDGLTYRNVFAEVHLNRKRTLYVEKIPAAPEFTLTGREIDTFHSTYITKTETDVDAPADETAFRVRDLERIPRGLQDYF